MPPKIIKIPGTKRKDKRDSAEKERKIADDGQPVTSVLAPVSVFYNEYMKTHPQNSVILCDNFGLYTIS